MQNLAVAAAVALLSAPLSAQSAPRSDRFTFDVGAGVSRYEPHAVVGLEAAMNRWLALRGEVLFTELHLGLPSSRYTALSVAGVTTWRRDARVTPYALAGYTGFGVQGFGAETGYLAGAGLRFRVGKFQPYAELRAQRGIGMPITFGLRF